MGNPGETDETAQQTIDVATGIRPNLAMFFVSTAYPGTPMYDQARRRGHSRAALVGRRRRGTRARTPRSRCAGAGPTRAR